MESRELKQTDQRLDRSQTMSNQARKSKPKRVSDELYAKVIKLFDALAFCDQPMETFDPEKAVVPASVSVPMLMMALKKVGTEGILKKVDVPRFKRIVINCSKLINLQQTKLERELSEESQMSGNHDDESEAWSNHSPLDNIRERVINQARESKRLIRKNSCEISATKIETDRSEAGIIGRLLVEEVAPDHPRPQNFIEFL